MKKTALIAGIVFLVLSATVQAQSETNPKSPETQVATDTVPKVEMQLMTDDEATTSNDRVSSDQWNNYNPDKYKLLPMPEPLTLEKKFPAIGNYHVTDKDGNTSDVMITLDESNKGIVWVEGLPQGKFKAMMMQVPATYKIPAQKTAGEKDIAEGVLIFNKEVNDLDVCLGCTYNKENPASAFAESTEAVIDDMDQAKTKKTTAKAKVTPVKTRKYSGSKIVETTASVAPMR